MRIARDVLGGYPQPPFHDQRQWTAKRQQGAQVLQEPVVVRLDLTLVDQLEHAAPALGVFEIHAAAIAPGFDGQVPHPVRFEFGRQP